MTQRLYGLAEIADALGVERNTVHQWHSRGQKDMPEPDWRLAMGPVWTGKSIGPWIRKQRRQQGMKARQGGRK